MYNMNLFITALRIVLDVTFQVLPTPTVQVLVASADRALGSGGVRA
jgi:hypothetical protein